MSFKPIDGAKEEYRSYLAKHGLLDALTKVLAKIQELQPENPLEFLHKNLAVSLTQQETIRDLEGKLTDAMQEIARLQKDNDRLKQSNKNSNLFGYSKLEK